MKILESIGVHSQKNPDAWYGKVAWSNSTGVIAIETAKCVRLVSASTLQEVGTIRGLFGVQWSPDDRYLSGNVDRGLRVWDVKLNIWASEVFKFSYMWDLPLARWRAMQDDLLIIHRDSPRVQEGADWYLYPTRFLRWVPGGSELELLVEFNHEWPDRPDLVCCVSTGKVVVVQFPHYGILPIYEGRITLWDGTTRSLDNCPSLPFHHEEWDERGFDGILHRNNFSPKMTTSRDGSTTVLVACTPHRTRVLYVWDIVRQSLVMSHRHLDEATMKQINRAHAIALSPRGRFLFVLATGSDQLKAAKNRLLVIDTRDGQVVAKWIGPSAVSSPGESRYMSLSPDGRTVVLSRRDSNRGVLEFIDVGEFSAA